MTEKDLLPILLDEAKKTNELLEAIKESLDWIETNTKPVPDIKTDLEALRAKLGA